MAKIKITQKRSVIGRTARQKATMDALLQMRDARSVATQRGISMSKVFNGK